ncbi:peptide methionine sulfoxide reductase MsrA [Litorimonas cladophorae]|uniref:Peptide methionine sulfoxide reductase MsrA n=1 Tax=Litorimonas cladophorae TaxID=1220491 RepID=A0A918NK85_9PROT|nr:peptide-methionine (S)-S-oxide reductase MsrA [Litorimonas cladophorae]GGX74302.1 peptide methionine sulfoxide reductase MsrA [Litorimonas cladophorae]
MKYLITAISLISLAACAPAQSSETPASDAAMVAQTTGPQAPFKSVRTDGLEEMIVAGGCFWCVESDFEKLEGVREAISGYTGGTLDNPTYKKVGTNRTGHFEAAKIIYDPAVISYRELVDYYWKTIDPTDSRGQFCDKGESYLSAIFTTPEQRADAEASLAQIKATKPFSADIVTPILPAVTFYDAEDYHQDYYKTNALQYKYYRNGCGRDRTLAKLWGDK